MEKTTNELNKADLEDLLKNIIHFRNKPQEVLSITQAILFTLRDDNIKL